ncbi:hypothetical protein Q6D67_05360 [Haliea sp. E1-2-M8]|uniref:MMPL family transporter n=1 Tax=Haliea sp. E1-2-M8 TaxID=3064706 RepID=UPI002726DEF4|nr:hypothetical protein [Haliea sp. E1-2-M8]MDO8861125.1 hypothetical protein [Haliea sp. E1-2-M8]
MSAPVMHRYLVGLWLLGLLIGGLYCGERILRGEVFQSNILGLIPERDEGGQSVYSGVTKNFEKRFVVMLSHPDPHQGSALAVALKEKLAQQDLVDMNGASESLLGELRDFFKPYRHQLLAVETRQRLLAQNPQDLAASVVTGLYSPVSGFRLYPFADDPFNLGGAWFQEVFPEAVRFRGTEIPSLRAEGRIWYLIDGQVRGSPFDLASQQALSTVLDDFPSQSGTQMGDADLLFSGVIFHATEAARLARSEISTVGSGSLLGILLLVIAVFRSRRALAAIAFTLLSSVLMALTISLLVFDRVHLVTLAFGTTLLGLAVDYCFHFLIKYRVHGDALVAGRLIRKGLLISAGSSIAAYLVQLVSPFPGLQQLAVFLVAGLVGACSAVLVLTLCFRELPSASLSPWLIFFSTRVEPAYLRLGARRLQLCCSLAAVLALLAGYLYWLGSSDDIRHLNSSSQSLLDSERKVQTLLGGIDPQRYWVVAGQDQQQVLERTEKVVAAIDDDRAPTARLAVAVTAMVPSLAAQRGDHALVASRLYGSDGAVTVMCVMLQSDCSQWQSLPGDVLDELEPSGVPATVAARFLPAALTTENRSIVLLRQGALPAQRKLESMAELPGVTYVDQVQVLSETLKSFRIEVTMLLAAFLGVFSLACIFFYGRRGSVVLVSVLASMFVSLALSAAGGVTLFHVLALLLVLGLTVDAAVFYLELGLNGETWLASTLASATSILAFGLLALSDVPLLHHFGSVVFFGLLAAWLITPLMFQLARGGTVPASLGLKS